MQVSITKALAEVKKLDNRLSTIRINNLGGVFKVKDEEAIASSKSEFSSIMQSYDDMMKRMTAIKSAIAKANVTTEVKDGKTIYDLIVSKDATKTEINRYKDVLIRVKHLEEVKEKEDKKLDGVINQVIEKAYGGTKPAASFVEDITKSHYDVNGSVIASPYTSDDLNKKIVELEDELVEIDIYLSEINSRTMITIPD